MIICLEGVDNTGKTTLLNKLEYCRIYKIKVIYNDNGLLNVEIPQELVKQLGVKKDAFPFFLRNYKMLEYAKTIEKSCDFVFLDRGFLSTSVYNSKHCKRVKMMQYALQQYEHLILYRDYIVPRKSDETLSQEELIIANYNYKQAIKKSNGYLINEQTQSRLYPEVLNMLDKYKKGVSYASN